MKSSKQPNFKIQFLQTIKSKIYFHAPTIKPIFILILLFTTLSPAQAVVKLDETLKPEYLPDIKVATSTQNQAGFLAVYIFQLLSGILLYFAAPIAILMIAIAGLMWASAHGEEAVMEKAKNTLKWAIIGLIVITFSFVIVRAIIQISFQADSLANI